MSTNIPQFLHCETLGALTHLYLELGLPLQAALQAAEADLWQLDASEESLAGGIAYKLLLTRCFDP